MTSQATPGPSARVSSLMSRVFRQTRLQTIGCGILVLMAVIWARMTLGPRPFDIFDTNWLWGDLAQVYISWSLYMGDPSAWFLQTDQMSYPLPMSISLFDPMPILLLILKPVAWLFPDGAQYFGYYFTLCLILQAVFGYLGISEILNLWSDPDGRGKLWPVVVQFAGAILILTAHFTISRFEGHTALSSQWLLILAIWIALRTRSVNGPNWFLANAGVLFFATGFNPYLAVMTGISLGAVALWQIRMGNALAILIRIGALLAAGVFGLWFFGFASGAEAGTYGFGVYSMNLLGPLDSNGHGSLLGIDVLDATTGQSFEGFTYVGLGVLLLIAFGGLSLYRSKIDDRLPLWMGASIIALACFLAVSTRVTLSGFQFEYPMPAFYSEMMSRFRASGRFFWVAGFWIVVLGVAVVARRYPGRSAAWIVAGLALVQWIDVAGFATRMNSTIATFQRLELQLAPDAFAEGPPEVIRIFPPWQCDPFTSPGGLRNYELTGYYALENKVVTNNFYAARVTDEQRAYHCDLDARVPELDKPGVYVFSDALYAAHRARIDSVLTCAPHPQFPGAVLCT